MSLHYKNDLENNLVRVWNEGRVTIDDIRDHWMELFQDPVAMKISRVLVDVRKGEIAFTGPEMMELTRVLYVPNTRGRDFRLAMVVKGMLQFGVARQLQTVAEGDHNHRIFTDMDQAMEWLMRPDE